MIFTDPGDFMSELVAKEIMSASPPLAQKITSIFVTGGEMGSPFAVKVKLGSREVVYLVPYGASVGEAARVVLNNIWIPLWDARKELAHDA
jgi:hypothetical protein